MGVLCGLWVYHICNHLHRPSNTSIIVATIVVVLIVLAFFAWILCMVGSDAEVKNTKKNFPFQ